MNEILIGAGTTTLGVVLSWWLTNLTTRRAEAKADKQTTREQADALIVAVFELQGLSNTNRVLWEGWPQRLRVGFLVVVSGWSGFSRAQILANETDRKSVLPLVAGLGQAAGVIERDLRDIKRAAVGVSPSFSKVITAAGPLLRNPDASVATATESLIAAIRDQVPTERLNDALSDFGRVVARSLEPRRTWWRRIARRPHQELNSVEPRESHAP